MFPRLPPEAKIHRRPEGHQGFVVQICASAGTAATATLLGVATICLSSRLQGAERPSCTTRPVLFSPEMNWAPGTDASPAFTPDGKTVFFTHSDGTYRGIMEAHQVDGSWSTPRPAPFSGKWRDIEPYMAPNGSYLVFISNRPTMSSGEPLDGFFGGKVQPRAGGNIWRVNRTTTGWSDPIRLPDSINSNSAIYSPAISADGSIYFNQPDSVTRRSHIYRAQSTRVGFERPVSLPMSNGVVGGYDVAIMPDESLMVFSSGRAPAKEGESLLFLAKRKHGVWSEPRPLLPFTSGLEARFGPDYRTLYFQSDPPPALTGIPPQQRIYALPFRAECS